MKNLKNYLLLFLFALCFAACSDDDDPAPIKPEGEVEDRGDISTDEIIEVGAAFLGNIPADLREAFEKRCPNNTSEITPTTMIAFVSGADINAHTEKVMELYNKGGIVVLVRPELDVMNKWLEENNLQMGVAFKKKDVELFAFNQYKQYILDRDVEDFTANENLNAFVTWTNYVVRANDSRFPDDSKKEIEQIISATELWYTWNYSHQFEEAHVILSDPDVIKGKGSITFKISYYPMYVFEGQDASGDYYLVQAEVVAHNADMCHKNTPTHNYWERHGGVYSYLCGFYMTELSIKAELINYDFVSPWGLSFPVGYSPTPLTTQNTTSYSYGKTWNIGGDFSIGYSPEKSFSGSMTFSGGVSYSNTKSYTLSDVNIMNNHDDLAANYTYKVYNLPECRNLKMTDPPQISVSNAQFNSEWIWHVAGTKDRSTQSHLLRITPSIEYGSCHFFSSRADFVRNASKIPSLEQVCLVILPPNRTPTGKLCIKNDSQDMYVFDIELKNLTTGEHKKFYEQESIAYGDSMERYVPEGKYSITFMMGKSRKTAKRYTLAEDNIDINRAQKIQLHSAFDFK